MTWLEDIAKRCHCLTLKNVGVQYIDSLIIRICVCLCVCVCVCARARARARCWAFTPISYVWSLFKLMWEKLHCIYWSLKQQKSLCSPANIAAELH